VGTAELDRDLQAVQALLKRLQGRRLVVLLQEQTIDEKGVTTTSGVTSTVLTDAFKRDGWTMIDPSFRRPGRFASRRRWRWVRPRPRRSAP
jgi:hypothetical protein